MDKEDVDLYVCIYLYTYTHREILLSYEKRNLAIYNNEDGSIRYYGKRNTNTQWSQLYVKSNKPNEMKTDT